MDADNSELIAKMNKISQEIFENTIVKDPVTGLETKPFKKPKIIRTPGEFFKEFGVPKKLVLPPDITPQLLNTVPPDSILQILNAPPGKQIMSPDFGTNIRELKATWSVEAAEDLKAVHGIEIEQKLVDAISEEMAKEIDKTILNDLFVTPAIEAVKEKLRELEREAAEAEKKRQKELTHHSTFSIIGRRYLDPEKAKTEEEPEIEMVERKVIVVVPDLPFGLGHRRVLV